MSKPTIGIIGGGQLGSMLSTAAKNLNLKTIIISDDEHAPAQFFAGHIDGICLSVKFQLPNFSQRSGRAGSNFQKRVKK